MKFDHLSEAPSYAELMAAVPGRLSAVGPRAKTLAMRVIGKLVCKCYSELGLACGLWGSYADVETE